LSGTQVKQSSPRQSFGASFPAISTSALSSSVVAVDPELEAASIAETLDEESYVRYGMLISTGMSAVNALDAVFNSQSGSNSRSNSPRTSQQSVALPQPYSPSVTGLQPTGQSSFIPQPIGHSVTQNGSVSPKSFPISSSLPRLSQDVSRLSPRETLKHNWEVYVEGVRSQVTLNLPHASNVEQSVQYSLPDYAVNDATFAYEKLKAQFRGVPDLPNAASWLTDFDLVSIMPDVKQAISMKMVELALAIGRTRALLAGQRLGFTRHNEELRTALQPVHPDYWMYNNRLMSAEEMSTNYNNWYEEGRKHAPSIKPSTKPSTKPSIKPSVTPSVPAFGQSIPMTHQSTNSRTAVAPNLRGSPLLVRLRPGSNAQSNSGNQNGGTQK